MLTTDTEIPFGPTIDAEARGVEAVPAPVVAGKDPTTGRFLPGNHLGRGSPLAGQAAKLRAALFHAVSTGDIKEVVGALIDKAKGGDVAAAKLVLQYTLGDPQSLDLVEKIERMEFALSRG